MTTADGLRALDDACGSVLAADMPAALPALRAIPDDALDGDEAAVRRRILERFDRPTPPPSTFHSGDAVADAIGAAFERTWWLGLTDPSSRVANEAVLLATLRKVVGSDAATMDDLEPTVQATLRDRGLHSLMGITWPFRELMAWRHQETRTYDVPLPHGPFTVRAELLDDFVTFGWAHYATAGRRATGGWATTDALYAVVPRYTDSLDGEPFTITFLGHETQHFADLTRHGPLEPWRLEYRSKLVEMAMADETRRMRLDRFAQSQSDDPAAQHPYANRLILRTLSAQLGLPTDDVTPAALASGLASVPGDRLRAAARAVLDADTATLPERAEAPATSG